MIPQRCVVPTMLLAMAIMFPAISSCERPRFVAGEGCELNSECASPLVCVFTVCRRQCIDSRDCGAGLRCLPSDVPDATLGGGCQLENERMCTLASECTAGLVCQNGTCTTECAEDRDCALGASCVEDTSGVVACHEERAELCIYNTDCPIPMVCARDQLCHLECMGDRDCTAPRRCVANLCELPDGGP